MSKKNKLQKGDKVTPNAKYMDMATHAGEEMTVTDTVVLCGTPCVWVDHPSFHGAYAEDGFGLIQRQQADL